MLRIALACAVALTGACTSTFLNTRDNGPLTSSTGAERGQQFFEGWEGRKLYSQWWRPAGSVRGVLVIVHGLKDHSSRYGELADRLAAQGFAVYALDLRGHAHSEGERVWIETFGDYTYDLDIFLKSVRAREPGRPLFLFGHSMGGAIVTMYALAHENHELDGVILHGAALELDVSGFKVASTKVVNAIAPHAGLFQLELADFSRDPNVVEAAKADPMVFQDGAPVRTAVELFKATDWIQHHWGELSMPLLVLHGTGDKLTMYEGSEDLVKAAGVRDKTLRLYPGLAHDLVHEPEKEAVMKDIEAWLVGHTR